MAINWDIQITEVNLDLGRADVVATRTDTATGKSKTYTLDNTPAATAAERQQILAWLKEQVLTDESRDATVAAFLTNLEQAAKSSLETWEAERIA